MEPTDRSNQDLTEFEALFHRSYQRAYSLAFRLADTVGDAEDLTQDAYVRAWRSFGTYDRSRSFEAWLLRILSNLAIDRWRRQGPPPVLSLDRAIEAGGAGSPSESMLADHAPGPEQQCTLNVIGERLQTALGLLPPAYRTATILADIEAQSYEDVAQRMRCPVGTVRSRLHRGRLELRRQLRSPALALSE